MPKVEGLIRTLLNNYRTKDDATGTKTRIINVVLAGSIVPSYYLGSFFEFIYDIYKLNFDSNLPDDLYGEFQFVYDGLQNVMRSESDEVQVNVTKKTYKLIKSTKQLDYYPIICDLGKLASDTKNLLIQDCSISDYEKSRLLELYNDVEDIAIAEFLCSCFLFGISRPFKKATKSGTPVSPTIADIILTTDIPKPVNDFINRDDDISAIETLLQQHTTLFITGMPGIGKSELAKQFAKEHKKDYTNILYLEYTGNFYEMIADLDFVDDTDTLSEKDRFKKHYRFLKSLQDDSLLIIDNFNTLQAEDSLLQQICSLKCTVLLTSRNHYDSYANYELTPSDKIARTLLECTLSKVSPEPITSYPNELNVILETVNYNLVATELIGRLLAYQSITPDTLCHKLNENVLLPQETNSLLLAKDNHRKMHVFQEHMLQLLGYKDLPKEEQLLLSYIALAPENGFPLKLLHKWCIIYTNHFDSLINKGLLIINCGRVTMKPYIRRLINAGKFLTSSDCEPLFAGIYETLASDDSELIQFTLYMIDMIERFVKNEPSTQWISIIRSSLEFNNRYHRYRSYSRLLGTYEYLCIKSDFENTSDRYLLEHLKAIEAWNIHNNINKAIDFEEKAILMAEKESV